MNDALIFLAALVVCGVAFAAAKVPATTPPDPTELETAPEVLAWRAGFVAGFVALNDCDCPPDGGGCATCLAYGEAVARTRAPLPDEVEP